MLFKPMPKIARLSREVIITEKIDGTNASILVDTKPNILESVSKYNLVTDSTDYIIIAGSRTRWIKLDDDNFGFAKWVSENWKELIKLGAGHHFGEWWGKGIQRGYGLSERRFSLFNVSRWNSETLPKCCNVVPTLYTGEFDTTKINNVLNSLKDTGSIAAPGYMNPEGVVIFHTQNNALFKKTFNDNHKG